MFFTFYDIIYKIFFEIFVGDIMNFNNKDLARISLLITLAVVVAILAYYIPALSILSFLTGSIFMIIGLISKNKAYTFISFMAYGFLLFILLDPVSAFIYLVVFCIPCLIMGYIMKNKDNEDMAYFVGTVVMAVAVLGLLAVFMRMSGFDFFENLRQSFEMSTKQLQSINPNYTLPKQLTVDNIVNISKQLFPSIVMITCLFMTLISKYMGLFLLRRIFPKEKMSFKPFSHFELPDRLGIFFLLFWLVINALSLFNILDKNYSDRLITNVLYLIIYMLVIEGLAVLIFFINKLNKGSRIIAVLITVILFWSAFFVLSFIAILDMAFDFRKLSFRRGK